MATPILDPLSVQHSKNIGDTVAAAGTDGKRWSSAQRTYHINEAIRRWIRKMIAVKNFGALRAYVQNESAALSSNELTVASFSDGVPDTILSVYDTTLTNQVDPLPPELSRWEAENEETAIVSGLYFVWDNSKLTVLNAGASDTVKVQYVKQHTDVVQSTGPDIAVPNSYYPQLLNLAEAIARREFPIPQNIARADLLEGIVDKEINAAF